MSNGNARMAPQADGSVWRLRKRLRNALFKFSNRVFGPDLTHRFRLARLCLDAYGKLQTAAGSAQRRQARFERDNPDLPWFVPDSIIYLEALLNPRFAGFEWGSGRSSVWFSRRVAHIICVEGRRDWYDQVKTRIHDLNLEDRIDLRLRAVTSEHNFDGEQVSQYSREIDTVPDMSLDFLVVDGHFRIECLLRGLSKVRPGGVLVLDNSDLPEFEPFHAVLTDAASRTFSNGIWETTIFIAPGPHAFAPALADLQSTPGLEAFRQFMLP